MQIKTQLSKNSHFKMRQYREPPNKYINTSDALIELSDVRADFFSSLNSFFFASFNHFFCLSILSNCTKKLMQIAMDALQCDAFVSVYFLILKLSLCFHLSLHEVSILRVLQRCVLIFYFYLCVVEIKENK